MEEMGSNNDGTERKRKTIGKMEKMIINESEKRT